MQRVEKKGAAVSPLSFRPKSPGGSENGERREIERQHKRGAQAVIIKPFTRAPVDVKMPVSNGILGIHETSANVFGLFE